MWEEGGRRVCGGGGQGTRTRSAADIEKPVPAGDSPKAAAIGAVPGAAAAGTATAGVACPSSVRCRPPAMLRASKVGADTEVWVGMWGAGVGVEVGKVGAGFGRWMCARWERM